MAAYIADPCPVASLSSGCAYKLVSESPLHAWAHHPRLGARPREASNVADAGSLAHDLLLGGEGKICVIDPRDYPSKPTKENPDGGIPKGWTNTAIRAARDEARSNGLVPVLFGDLFAIRAMVDAAKAYIAGSQLAGLFDDGESELTAIAQEGPTWLRARPDWLTNNGRWSLSYKTTKARVHPEGFSRIADSMGYGFSLAFYARVLRGVGWGSARSRHLMLAQEQNAPFACSLFELAPAKAAIEHSQVERAIRLWARCMAEGKWPGYTGSIVALEPRPWDLAAEEARLQAEELEAMETA